VNVIGFNTVPQDMGVPEDGEVSLLCSVIGEDLNKLVWIRASDSSKCKKLIVKGNLLSLINTNVSDGY
jgi:hypothetical protein